MKFRKKTLFTFLVIGFSLLSHAQTGVGTVTPNKSSQLDISSTNRGLLLPRVMLVKTTEQTPIINAATSLMVYNTSTRNDVTPGYYYWDGAKWARIARTDEIVLSPEQIASLKGEPGTNGVAGPQGPDGPIGPQGLPGIGGKTNAGTNITVAGAGTQDSPYIVNAIIPTAVGTADNGLTVSNGTNVQLGGTLSKPTEITTAGSNTLAIKGLQTGASSDNLVVTDANGVLKTITKGSIGDNLGNHTADRDLAMSGKNINNADNITATGTVSGANVTASTKATLQTAQISKGSDGSTPAPGYIATSVDTSGNIAWKAPEGATEWYKANTTTDAGSDKDNGMYRNGKVGIGVNNPTALLDLNNGTTNGAIKIVDGTQGNGKVLTSDSNGLATWQTRGPQTLQGNVSANPKFWNPAAGIFYTGYSIEVPAGRSTITAGFVVIVSANGYVTARLSTSSTTFNQVSGVTPPFSGFTVNETSMSAGQVTWYANNTASTAQTYYVWMTAGGLTKGSGDATLGGSSDFGEAYIMVAF